MSQDIDEIDLEIWKTVVSVQMHFNELELKIRNFAILSLGAILTIAGYSARADETTKILGQDIPYASIIMIAGCIIWLCFWFMDRHWYHRLLLGAVYHGIKIESKYENSRPTLSLSATIKENSPNEFLGREVRSHHRLNLFYWVVAVTLFVGGLGIFSLGIATVAGIVSLLFGSIVFFVSTETHKST
ncbi:hypothetical protein [Maritalea porphyrae]|uniref:Uncharacterized protein n=1 Tax=Maritalea porphyrae TaxID=880732 RepID=A0ABQ5URF1_9HYPH|nr:hypothetical protein [Maritalea porphyrae]GLQ17727.1 hypothetical protein GCM10007879_19760 [Maritalea porphyrae]